MISAADFSCQFYKRKIRRYVIVTIGRLF